MLEVADARQTVLRYAAPLRPEGASLSPGMLGRVLAEDVRADVDSPPFTKSLMDGYAVRSADLAGGPAELVVIEEVPAGAVPTQAVGPGQATALYTGAPVPDGADAVVMVERTEALPGGRVRVHDPKLAAGRNVLPRGREMAVGEVVLPAGTVLTPAALGLLAAVGRTEAAVISRPWVGVLVTGNELVEADAKPGPGQIRNTNGPMLAAQVVRAGGKARVLGIGRDDRAALTELVRRGFEETDVLVLAGGVSVGAYDLVPDVLRELGVEVHFHRVRMKPGKPLLFGTRGEKLVFGLPGNPVGAFVGFELFVRPALRALSGHDVNAPLTQPLQLTAAFTASNDRPTFHPARRDGAHRVAPLPWFGSADLRALLAADALLALPPGEVKLAEGEWIESVLLEEMARG
jgi:molybdopterin molybdotransferase